MKTTHTIYSTFAKHNMASLRLLLVMLLTLTASTAWAETYSWTCSGTTTFSTSGSSLNGVNWKASIEGSSAGTGVSGEKCVQIAKNNGLTLETTGFNNKNITSISIQTWGSQQNTFYLKDGDTQLATTQIPKSYSSNGAKISFSDVGVIKTKLVFSWSSATKAFNVRSITITYEDAAPSCSEKPTVGTELQSVTATENSITATIPITAVGGCNITENGLVYSTTNSTPTVDGSACTTVTTTACGSTAANKTVTITGLTCGQSYYIRGYATNEAGTSYTNVTTKSTSDCPKYTVTLMDDTDNPLTQSTAGGSVTLPPRDGCKDYTFAGWTNTWIKDQTTWTTTAPTIIPAGSYTPTANENLYPVYTKTEGGGTSYQFQQVTALSQIKDGGTFIITNGSYYLPNAQASSSGPLKADMVEVTNNGVVTGTVTDDMKWTFSAADANGKITIKSAANSNYYLYTTNDNNGLRVYTTSDTWTFEEYTVSNILGFAMKSTSRSRYCAVYTDGSNWRSYTTKDAGNYETNSGRLDLYKSTEISSNTTYYISVPNCCTQLAEVTNLKFSSITSNSITVAVPDDYSDIANASGYTFNCYSASTGGTLIATADESGTSHTFTGLTKNTTYYFTVIAKGEGDYCNSVETSARESSKTLTQYTITLNPNGGTGDFSGWSNYTMTVDAGTEITLPELSKTGYDFAGWHDGGTTVASSYTPTKDITLTAQWTAIEYTIKYNDTKGATNSNPTTYTIEDAITFADLTNLPKGYNFTGWNPASIARGTTGNQTVTAQWTEKPLTRYRTDCDACIPLDGYAEINGTYHFFPGETITLTVTPPADAVPYTYQWQKFVEDEWEDIDGKTTTTYTKAEATIEDVGHYRCVVSAEGYCDAIAEYNVKCLQLNVYYNDHSSAFTTPLEKVDATTATISVDLQNANYTYYFEITDGCENFYGFNGDIHSGWYENVELNAMNSSTHCGLQTTKFGTYIFTVDHSYLTDDSKLYPIVTVTYPASLQEADKVIYLDNHVLDWTNPDNAEGKNKIYYRIGHENHNSKTAMTLVPGTANLYKVTTSEYNNFEVWHIANNGCWSDNHPIYKTKTGDDWAATQATAFETLPVTLESVTVTPTTSIGNGGEDRNSNCEFFNYDITEGMKTWNAEVIEPTNGTITVKYTHHDGTAVNNFTSGNRDLAHTCLLTITATANEGYSLASLTVNDVPFTSGNIHTLTEDAVIKAEFTINTHTVTWKPAGGNWGGNFDDIVEEYAYGEEIKAPEKPAYDCHEFDAWDPVYTVGMTMPDNDLEFTAQWNKLSYTISFKNYDGTVLQTSTVECGETPIYTGATPTREQTAQYTYTFKGWSPTIASVTQDQVYTAQFTQTTRQYTVTWYDGTGNAHKTQTAGYNATVALPTTNPEPCDDQYPHFIGWTADPIVGPTTTQPELVENVKVTGDCDYYAVFAKGEAGGGGSYVLDYTAENLGSSNKWGSYGTAYTHTAKDGSTWVIKAYKNAGMQINTGKNASIKIPTCPSPITSIEVTGTTSKAVGLSASDYTGSGTITYIASGTDATNQTLDLSEKSVTGGYIVAKSGSISITKITVNFTAPTNYTSFITTCCTSWSAPTLTYTTPLNAETSQTAEPQLGSGTTHGKPTYTSSNPSVLAVNEETGVVTAIGKGTATITVTWEGNEPYCSVSVTSNTITVNGSYSVTFHSNGGTGTMEPQKADPSTQRIAKLNKNEFTKADYVFVGWKDASGVAYTDEQENITLTKNITLFAQWAPVVTLNDAGSEETLNPTAVNGTITLPDGANACDSYEFVGWTAAATADWNNGIEEPALVASPYKPTQPTTLYAVYKIQSEGNPNAFKLSFEGSNGKTYYVGEYASSPYLRGFSNITKEEAVTFIRTKMYPDDDTKYYLYLEYKEEYYYYNSSYGLSTTSSAPNENQGWVFHTVGDKIQIQAIGQERYLSYVEPGSSDTRTNITTHATGSQGSFNMLPAVTSTYVAAPLCNQEITITFETGNGDFVANAPKTNPLIVTMGETITLPTCEYQGYEFLGWLKDKQQLEPSYDHLTYYTGDYPVGGTSSSITFYAYYKAVPEEVEFTGKDDAKLLMYYYDGTANYYYASSFDGGNGELPSMQNCFNATTWTFTNVGNMQYHIQDETGKYLGAYSDGDNDLILSATPKVWTFTEVNGLWKMVCENSPSRALMYISTGKTFTNAAISNEGNGAYSYVALGICPYPTYTTNPVLSQGFSITNTAMVTSASGQKVKATSALTLETHNIEMPCTFTISAPNITFYDTNGNEVTELQSSTASEQFELHFAYKPTAENTMEYPTITITDDEMKTYTIKNRIYARSLPADFVIAAKTGNSWVALTANITSTGTQAAPLIMVDNIALPTKATITPNTTRYQLLGLQTDKPSIANSRFKNNGAAVHLYSTNVSKVISASTSTDNNKTYINADAAHEGAANSSNCLFYEWQLQTNDLIHYTLVNSNTTNTSNTKLGYSATYAQWGMYQTGNNVIQEVLLLPIEKDITEMDVEVMEWGTNSMALRFGGEAPATVDITLGATTTKGLSLANLNSGNTSDIYKVEGLSLAGNDCEALLITDATDASKGKLLRTPILVNGEKNGSDYTNSPTRDVCMHSDIVILNGGKLTADEAKSVGSHVDFANIYVYPGGKLVLDGNSLGVKQQVYLRGGYSWLNQTTYALPEVYLNGEINFNGSGNMIYDYYIQNHKYYQFALPYNVQLENVTDEAGKDNFPVWVKHYNGALRADDANATSWEWYPSEGGDPTESFIAGEGYIIAAKPRQDGNTANRPLSIIRFPLGNKAFNETNGIEMEKSVTTIAHGINGYKAGTVTANNVGWNFIGNPYLSTWKGDIGHKQLSKYPNEANWDGTYDWVEAPTKYITIMSPEDGTDYAQYVASNTELKPFFPFYMQETAEGGEGTITFTLTNRMKKAPAEILAAIVREAFVQIEIVDGDNIDQTGLYVSDKYSDDIDFDDLEKMFGTATDKAKAWFVHDSKRMAFESMTENRAAGSIPLGYRAPQEGTYTFTINEEISELDCIENIYLTDYENGIIDYDLLLSDYKFESQSVLYNDTRFTVRIIMKEKGEGTVTGVDYIGVQDELPIKFIYQDKIFILHNETIYDATGKKVTTINK